MTWIKFAYWLLRFANNILSSVQQEKLIQLGEDRQGAKALLALNENARVLREIDARFDKMTDAQVRAALEANGDFRDD